MIIWECCVEALSILSRALYQGRGTNRSSLPVVEIAHLHLCNALELFYQCDLCKLLASLSTKQQSAAAIRADIAAQVYAQEARIGRIETDLDWVMVLQQHLHLLKTWR
ncbi:hypothetical protein MW887_011032, partial [Aspergillus wentii]